MLRVFSQLWLTQPSMQWMIGASIDWLTVFSIMKTTIEPRIFLSNRNSAETPTVADFHLTTQIAKFMGPTWGPPGSCRPQMGFMLAPWNLLSGYVFPFGHWPVIFGSSGWVQYSITPMAEKYASRAGASKYIPQYLWDMITCPCPWNQPECAKSRYKGCYLGDVTNCVFHW